MSIEVQAIQRVRAFVESTFGADSSGSAGSFTDLPIVEGSVNLTLTRDELNTGILRQHIDDGTVRVLGKRRAVLSFQVNLATTGTLATTSVSAVTSPMGLLLKAVMGGEELAQGSTSAAGSTASVINVQPGHGSRWSAGKAMVWINTAGIPELREVESVSTDAITLKRAFSGSPASTNPLYNCATYYMTAKPAQSLAMIVEGLEADDRWLLTGGQADGGFTYSLDMTAGAIPRLTFNFTFANWRASNETSSSLTGTLGAATYTATSPLVGEAGAFELWTMGTATYAATQLLPVSACSFEPHCQFAAVTSPSGTNTIQEWQKTTNPDGPVKGSFTLPYEATTYFANRNARDTLGLMYMAGSSTAGFALSAPTVQLLNPQRVPDSAGFAAQTVMWTGRRDGDVGSSTTDLARSPHRLHIWG